MVLLVKDSENVGGRLARFELGCELMGEKVILSLLFIIFQCCIENGLEIGRGGFGSREGTMGHGADCKEVSRAKELW
jgi:hypothetical protein